jgi:hypothetical protein
MDMAMALRLFSLHEMLLNFYIVMYLYRRLSNDNQAALNLASSPMIGKGLRHVELRAHYFKDAILRGIVQPVWRPTHQLLADFPTKPVMGPRFHELDDWYRNGVPWDKIPKLPPQPNSVFQMGVSQGAAQILQTMRDA